MSGCKNCGGARNNPFGDSVLTVRVVEASRSIAIRNAKRAQRDLQRDPTVEATMPFSEPKNIGGKWEVLVPFRKKEGI